MNSKLTLSLVVLAWSIACLQATAADHPKIGSPAPPISVRGWITDEIKEPNPFRGKTIILEFWATWCAPCIAAIPHLNKLAEKFASKDVVFVSITSEERSVVEKFLTSKTMKSSVVLDDVIDGLGATEKAYGVTGIPHTFLIDKKGILRWHGHPNTLSEALLDQYFRTGKLPSSEQKREEPHTLSSISQNAFYSLVISRSQSISTNPKLHGLGSLITRNETDTSEIIYRAGSVVDFISKLFEQPTIRIDIVGDPPREIFDLHLRLTVPTLDSLLNTRAVQALEDVFGMKMKYVTETRKGWALTLAFPDRLKPSSVSKGYSTALTDSTWIGVGVSIPVFVRGLESQLKEHFFDETNADGRFDFDVRTNDFKVLRSTLEQQYGIVLREAERPIQIIRLFFPNRKQQ